MSNPYFDRNPAFNGAAERSPNGYPTMPGYTPGAGAGTATVGPGDPQGGVRHGQYGGHPQGGHDMADLERSYRAPSADAVDTERMTYNDVTMTTGMLLGILVVAAAFNWMIMGASAALTFGGAIVGLVLGLVQAFKREPSKPLILAYTVAQGLFLGGISAVFGAMYEGIVLQAVLATVATLGVSLFLFASGRVRVTGKFTRFLLIGMLGYLAFSLVNVVLMLTGLSDDPWGLRGATIMGIPLGVLVGLFAVFLAAMSLIQDFDSIQRGVRAGAPRRYAWSAAFGLMVTLIWLYVEILRILAILRGDN